MVVRLRSMTVLLVKYGNFFLLLYIRTVFSL